MRLTALLEITDSHGTREVPVVGRVRWRPGKAQVDEVVVESIDGWPASVWTARERSEAETALVWASGEHETDTEAA